MSALTISGLVAGYGAIQVLHDVSLEIPAGRIVTIVGANGAGKTTLLKTIAGVVRPWRGSVLLDGETIGGRPSYMVARRGVVLVPEGRGIFGDQTVRENLLLGALARRDGREPQSVAADLERNLCPLPGAT